ncbi:MAG TPA: WYL domain-containing protein [Intrasporangium sp.]|uniref:helix-turn-helix transcriptional regulator n=1 Tax=Intrasporangium sp. TaxID=1925024 RepID=UPI002D791A9B|nr:WYL domain-containing protein [Intrasporangium sp.]HET7397113.1 WYL domain-containing protein [Intrasporangium sp.]
MPGAARRGGRSPAETATQRLSRLLAMVPWLVQHPGVPVAEAAHEFGVSERQIEEDLELLFVCGTPGHSHAELIDAEWDTGHIFLRNADDIARPLRLTRDEAVTLTAGLHALESALVGPEVIERTLAKLRAATGADERAHAVALDIDDGRQHPAMEPLRGALADHRRVHLTYFVPTRDESTERDVDPMRIVNLDGHWYLEGWCHRAVGVRLFRLDRVEAVTVLDEDGTPPPQAAPRDLDVDLFVPGENDVTVVLEADREAAWVADYYPNEGVEQVAGGSLRITMRVGDPTLVRRLVLQLGGALRVVEPVQLAEAVAAEARAALTAYGEGLGQAAG